MRMTRMQATAEPLAKPTAMEELTVPQRLPPSDEALRLSCSQGIGADIVFRARPVKPSFEARFRWHAVGDDWLVSPRDDSFLAVPAPQTYSRGQSQPTSVPEQAESRDSELDSSHPASWMSEQFFSFDERAHCELEKNSRPSTVTTSETAETEQHEASLEPREAEDYFAGGSVLPTPRTIASIDSEDFANLSEWLNGVDAYS